MWWPKRHIAMWFRSSYRDRRQLLWSKNNSLLPIQTHAPPYSLPGGMQLDRCRRFCDRYYKIHWLVTIIVAEIIIFALYSHHLYIWISKYYIYILIYIENVNKMIVLILSSLKFVFCEFVLFLANWGILYKECRKRLVNNYRCWVICDVIICVQTLYHCLFWG